MRIKFSVLAITTVGVLVGIATSVVASVIINRMSFEEVLSGSDLVVLGKVVESPEIGALDPKLGVRRQHTIWVEQYIKGDGPDEITVITQGGKYWKDTPDGRKLFEGISDAAPQLPAEETEVLLFLRSGYGGYLIYSATHGIVPVTTNADGTRTVRLLFSQPDGMPPDTLRAYKEGLARGSKAGQHRYGGMVSVEELKTVAHRVLAPKP